MDWIADEKKIQTQNYDSVVISNNVIWGTECNNYI
jgi:hypothetical protein